MSSVLVDWFEFWLKGEENEGSEKSEQYSRWRKLRADRPTTFKPSTTSRQ
jgi:hypothetical protein